MTDQQPVNIIELAKQFRKALEARDNKALNQIIQAYGAMYQRLQDKIKVLTLEIANIENLTAANIRKLDSYKSLIVSIEKELTKFQGYAGTVMQQAASDAIKAGVKNARLLTLAGNPTVAASFKNLNPKAVENLISYFGEGSALMKRLDELAGTNSLRVAQTIIDNVALGKNPKTIAGLIKNSLGGGLTDALRMTRTVQIYSYREANRATYLANADLVEGWVWMAELDDLTCEACYIEHGTFHKNDETLNGHYNCRCTPLPVTIGSQNPITESGIDKFNNMDESQQRALVGDSKYDLISSGKIQFQDLLTTRESDVYGSMVAIKPLKELIGE